MGLCCVPPPATLRPLWLRRESRESLCVPDQVSELSEREYVICALRNLPAGSPACWVGAVGDSEGFEAAPLGLPGDCEDVLGVRSSSSTSSGEHTLRNGDDSGVAGSVCGVLGAVDADEQDDGCSHHFECCSHHFESARMIDVLLPSLRVLLPSLRICLIDSTLAACRCTNRYEVRSRTECRGLCRLDDMSALRILGEHSWSLWAGFRVSTYANTKAFGDMIGIFASCVLLRVYCVLKF